MKVLVVFNYWELHNSHTTNAVVDVPGGKLTAEAVEEIRETILKNRSNKTGLRGSVTILNIIKLDQ